MDEKKVREQIQVLLFKKKVSVMKLADGRASDQKRLNNQINGDTAISLDTILLLSKTFPDVSLDWLIRGEGEMYRKQESAPYVNQPGAHDNAQHFGSGDINVGTTGKKTMTKDEMLQTLLQQQQQIINLMKE